MKKIHKTNLLLISAFHDILPFSALLLSIDCDRDDVRPVVKLCRPDLQWWNLKSTQLAARNPINLLAPRNLSDRFEMLQLIGLMSGDVAQIVEH